MPELSVAVGSVHVAVPVVVPVATLTYCVLGQFVITGIPVSTNKYQWKQEENRPMKLYDPIHEVKTI